MLSLFAAAAGGQRRGAGAVVSSPRKKHRDGSRRGHDRGGGGNRVAMREAGSRQVWFCSGHSRGTENRCRAEHPHHQRDWRRAVVKLETTPLTYDSGGIDLVAHQLDADSAFADSNQPITDDKFTDGELSDDGTTIEWTEIPAVNVNLAPETTIRKGFNLVIKGLRANASALGDGEDITATVLVGGTAVHSAPLEVADVTTGLQVKADAAELLRCADDATAAIKIQKGFANAIMSAASATDDRLVVTFTGIPEGLKVMVPDSSPTRRR